MSKIGKKPIPVPEEVEVSVDNDTVRVSGPKGELERVLNSEVTVQQKDDSLIVSATGIAPRHKAMWGLNRALLNNMIQGVTEGYTKSLEMKGLGYGAQVRDNTLVLKIGYSHPVEVRIPQGLKVTVENKTVIVIEGADKQLVGQFAAKVRALRKPEPYKGRGIRYLGEKVRRKAGKAAKVGVGGGL
jgi:large subunit ribosomal protein L6